jgi:hypothetical protein
MRLLSRPPIVGLILAVLLAGAGTAAAGGRLDLFDAPDDHQARPFGVRRVDLATASAAAEERGFVLPAPGAMPRGVTGDPAYLVAGPGVAAVWGPPDGPPRLIVGRAIVPEDFPVVSAIAALADDRLTTTAARVGGSSATVLATPDGALSAVVWLDGEVTTVVAGSFTADEIVAIAGSVE